MRLNEHTLIEGRLVYLVPYERHHVTKYHDWMKSEELLAWTASEPLSLEEEYQMQRSWREDSDKCTFIILCKKTYDETKNEIDAMVGDTNIFLKNEPDHAEIEIMIAESSAQGKGLGKESVLLMMRYGIFNLDIKIYRAIISVNNTKSLNLFKSLQFEMIGENKVFDELILEKRVSAEWTNWIVSNTQNYVQREKFPLIVGEERNETCMV